MLRRLKELVSSSKGADACGEADGKARDDFKTSVLLTNATTRDKREVVINPDL